ncbi:hypothetical protein [Leisingera caerulea]|uniref:hypothetical protein n=1 Tax=Leisingera caerulea TaxID=506591 RepID=UPI00041F25B9|nr:hypothetical protein [Leisingera caerulea]
MPGAIGGFNEARARLNHVNRFGFVKGQVIGEWLLSQFPEKIRTVGNDPDRDMFTFDPHGWRTPLCEKTFHELFPQMSPMACCKSRY